MLRRQGFPRPERAVLELAPGHRELPHTGRPRHRRIETSSSSHFPKRAVSSGLAIASSPCRRPARRVCVCFFAGLAGPTSNSATRANSRHAAGDGNGPATCCRLGEAWCRLAFANTVPVTTRESVAYGLRPRRPIGTADDIVFLSDSTRRARSTVFCRGMRRRPPR